MELFQPFRPGQGGTQGGQFRVCFRANPPMELEVFTQHPLCVLAHLPAGKQLRNTRREIQPRLQHARVDFDAQIMVGQQQSPAHVRRLPAGVKKPSGRTRGIQMQELQKLFLQPPQVAQRLLRYIERAQVDDAFQEGQIRLRITGG